MRRRDIFIGVVALACAGPAALLPARHIEAARNKQLAIEWYVCSLIRAADACAEYARHNYAEGWALTQDAARCQVKSAYYAARAIMSQKRHQNG